VRECFAVKVREIARSRKIDVMLIRRHFRSKAEDVFIEPASTPSIILCG
jgi:hypothetical protein